MFSIKNVNGRTAGNAQNFNVRLWRKADWHQANIRYERKADIRIVQ